MKQLFLLLSTGRKRLGTASAQAARLALLASALLIGGCSKASDSSKQMPKLPPPPHAAMAVPIAVTIANQPAPAIDAARLAAQKPDFQDEEHRAWRLSTLLGDHGLYAVTGENDVMVQFRRAPEKEPQPALMLTRRGEPVALLIDPTDPFPSYHGQGRRLGRPGDPMPRIGGVKQIRVEDPK